MENILKKYNISYRDAWFMIILVCAQAITAIWAKNDVISFISGMAGIISVVLCSQKKLTFYLFGFIQLFTYCFICFQQHLWGEVIENWFYAITMIIGFGIWIKNYNKEKYEVIPKSLSFNGKVTAGLIFMLGTLVTAFVLDIYTNDPYPWLDAISTVPAFIAQILMICGYKEQWRYWIIVDITSIIMWMIIGNPFMVVQFVLWTINCIYGIMKWEQNR